MGPACLDDDDLQELESLILVNPQGGDVVRGSGGLRKLRFSPSRWRRGKRGALRSRVCARCGIGKGAGARGLRQERQGRPDAGPRREIRRILAALSRAEGTMKGT